MEILINILISLLILYFAFLLLYVVIGVVVLIKPLRPNLQVAYLKEVYCGGIEENWCLTHDNVNLFIRLNDKHYLIGDIYFACQGSSKFVICVHGWGYNRNGMLKYVDMLNEVGYNVVVYDQRGFGVSSGKFITLGNREKEDLYQVIQYLKRNYHVTKIGLLGVSMGAATSLLYQEKYGSADFIIEDCGFYDFKQLLKERIKIDYKLPTHPLILIELVVRLFLKYSFKTISPIYEIDKLTTTPVLFIHGKDDPFISVKHCYALYAAKKGVKDILIIKSAQHAGAIITGKTRYQKKVQEFINRYAK